MPNGPGSDVGCRSRPAVRVPISLAGFSDMRHPFRVAPVDEDSRFAAADFAFAGTITQAG